jgi:hypothetical protein
MCTVDIILETFGKRLKIYSPEGFEMDSVQSIKIIYAKLKGEFHD